MKPSLGTLSIAAAIFGAIASPAIASISIIDPFSSAPDGKYPVVAGASDPVQSFGFEYQSDILRGVRYVQLSKNFNSDPNVDGEVEFGIAVNGSSELSLVSPQGYIGDLFLFYGFVPPGPDVQAFNFTDSDAFVVDFNSIISPTGEALTVRAEVYDNFGETWSITVPVAPSSGPTQAIIPFADFNLVDFSNIDDLVFTVTTPSGSSVSIDTVGTRLIPAPAAGCVLALAGVVSSTRRRRA
jgi:hypothetical protein